MPKQKEVTAYLNDLRTRASATPLGSELRALLSRFDRMTTAEKKAVMVGDYGRNDENLRELIANEKAKKVRDEEQGKVALAVFIVLVVLFFIYQSHRHQTYLDSTSPEQQARDREEASRQEWEERSPYFHGR